MGLCDSGAGNGPRKNATKEFFQNLGPFRPDELLIQARQINFNFHWNGEFKMVSQTDAIEAGISFDSGERPEQDVYDKSADNQFSISCPVIPMFGGNGHGSGRVIRCPRILFEETSDFLGEID